TTTLVFDPNEDRSRAEQRSDPLTETSGYVWIATRPGGASLEGLRRLGHSCGYTVYEADLAAAGDRILLGRAGLTSDDKRLVLARHPTAPITAPHAIARLERPFLLPSGDGAQLEHVPQQLPAGGRLPPIRGPSGRPGIRAEVAVPGFAGAV